MALFGVDSSVLPLVKPVGCITHSPLEKATLFADVFDSKQNNEKHDILLSCFREPKLNRFAFWSGEVKQLLLDLDSSGAVNPNGIFPLLSPQGDTVFAGVLCLFVRLSVNSFSQKIMNGFR